MRRDNMENFGELLGQYLDDEIINEKKQLDKEEVIDINNKKKVNGNYFNTVAISDFVTYYLGTDHDCKNLKHKGLKSFDNPYVIGISNEFALKNPDCVRRNEIIVVMDSYGNPGAYINPLLLTQMEDMESYKTILKLLSDIRTHNFAQAKILYEEYAKIVSKIEQLEKQYIDGCDLLNQLQKKSILKEIKEYAKEAALKGNEFASKQNEVLASLLDENKLLENKDSIRKENKR